MKNLTIISGITSLVIGLQLPATAATFTEINFFGDSLLDQGNLFNATSFPPSPPYFEGRFSNGKIVSDVLAEELDLNPILVTQLATTIPTEGVNFAVGGATTGANNVGGSPLFGLEGQIASFANLTNIQPADPNGLYVLWAGANDYNEVFFNPDSLTVSIEQLPDQVTSNLSDAVQSLYDLGARNFLVPNLPDLGITPFADFLDEFNPNIAISTQLSNLTTAHNNLLEVKLTELDDSLSETNISLLDANALLSDIITNPSSFGISDLDNSCLTNFQPGFMFDGICSNPDEFLFWDNIHPTAAVHQLIAEEALEVLQQQESENVPEPNNNWGLLSMMFLGLIATAKKYVRS